MYRQVYVVLDDKLTEILTDKIHDITWFWWLFLMSIHPFNLKKKTKISRISLHLEKLGISCDDVVSCHENGLGRKLRFFLSRFFLLRFFLMFFFLGLDLRNYGLDNINNLNNIYGATDFSAALDLSFGSPNVVLRLIVFTHFTLGSAGNSDSSKVFLYSESMLDPDMIVDSRLSGVSFTALACVFSSVNRFLFHYKIPLCLLFLLLLYKRPQQQVFSILIFQHIT